MRCQIVQHFSDNGCPLQRWRDLAAGWNSMENVLAGPRGKASLEEKLSISKCWFSVQRVWHSRVQVLDGQKGQIEKNTFLFKDLACG